METYSRICRITGLEFQVDELEQSLLRRLPELNPVLGTEPLPLPTVHPLEAIRRMYTFGGLRNLYKSKSAISGTPQLTRYNPALGTKICTTEEFFSDQAANEQHGKPYDFAQPFFNQFETLLYTVCLPPLNRTNCENSEYTNGAVDLKDCYLCFASFRSLDCLYCVGVETCTDCLDCVGCTGCELCFSCICATRCYSCHNSLECYDSQDLFGCYDCRSCNNCFGCVGLFHSSYCVFNEQLTKERYQQFISGKKLGSHTARVAAVQECADFKAGRGHVANTVIDCVNSSGMHLLRCENVSNCTNTIASTNCSYLIMGKNSHYFCKGYADSAEFGYYAHLLGATVGTYSYSIFGGEAAIYSAFCYGCSHCFGSIGLRNKSYCILNRQYTKQEYHELVPRIIAHMKRDGDFGEWFPQRIAPHSYQESSANEFFDPLPIEIAIKRGYPVMPEETSKETNPATSSSEVPDTIDPATSSSLLSKPLVCCKTGQRFNLQKRELEFYLRNDIPLPRIHWNERLQEMINKRGLFPAV